MYKNSQKYQTIHFKILIMLVIERGCLFITSVCKIHSPKKQSPTNGRHNWAFENFIQCNKLTTVKTRHNLNWIYHH